MVDTTHKGSKAVTEVRLAGGSYVELSATLRGFDGININQDEDTRPIGGGGGRIGTQFLGYKAGRSALTVDINPFTVVLFWMKGGRRFEFRHYPRGRGSGLPVWSWAAVCSIRNVFAARGVGRHVVTALHDGEITQGVQS